jgi:hypothetical protein
MISYSKCTRTLTFENVCKDGVRPPRYNFSKKKKVLFVVPFYGELTRAMTCEHFSQVLHCYVGSQCAVYFRQPRRYYHEQVRENTF